ncbi:hypothetical protein CUJ83_11400 [Methanocella sp. CWC-04]|uniref:Uncharacterized protein n=1 Tax=Methanooceanicella nereidis TaxID=2052831 RepID=A0AAP2W7U9_9EURY|nr:YkgJ family cysteine cluster protein [Methanocella sp. CWC-04]MCD1295604.1 hypothetical protein [Methanocella sp. CWC-04]
MENETFTCSKCGSCCAQRLVLLNTADIYRIADHFGLPVDKFMEKYGVIRTITAENKSPRLYLKIIEDKCHFYSDGPGCTIHEVKPLICRLFPGLKPRQTAGDIKSYINKHKIDSRIGSCGIFSLPDSLTIDVDKEALITTAIYDSIEKIYFRDMNRQDLEFVHGLLRMAERDDLRGVVEEYIFNSSRENGLAFEQVMFEIQALCQVHDWSRTPVRIEHEGISIGDGIILVHVSTEDAEKIFSMSSKGEIQVVFSQANASVADEECIFLSVAIKTSGDEGLMLAFPMLKSDLRELSFDGTARLGFFPIDNSMEQICAVNIRIDTTILD